MGSTSATSRRSTRWSSGTARSTCCATRPAWRATRPALDTDPADFDAVVGLNLRAAYFLAQRVARAMPERGGSIVQVSSQMGHVGGVDRAVYCATKHGVEGMTKAMAIEWGPRNIRVNTICPTFIRTPLTQATFDDPERRAWIEAKIKLPRVGEGRGRDGRRRVPCQRRERPGHGHLDPRRRRVDRGMSAFPDRYSDFPDFVIGITKEIWEDRGVATLHDYYAPGIVVRSPASVVVGNEDVIGATMATLAEFPDRQLLGEDVIWHDDPETGALSSHRLMCTATHAGDGVYGPATWTKLRYRILADCYADEGRMEDEWLVRDQGAIVRQLGHAPRDFAADLIEKEGGPDACIRPMTPETDRPGPYRGRGNDDPWGVKLQEIVTRIMAADMRVIPEAYDRAVELAYPGGLTGHGYGDADKFWMALRAAFPKAEFKVDHVIGREDPRMAPRAAIRWSLWGRHDGWGGFGTPSGAMVYVLGITHAEFGPRGLRREWTLYDETAIWKQIHLDPPVLGASVYQQTGSGALTGCDNSAQACAVCRRCAFLLSLPKGAPMDRPECPSASGGDRISQPTGLSPREAPDSMVHDGSSSGQSAEPRTDTACDVDPRVPGGPPNAGDRRDIALPADALLNVRQVGHAPDDPPQSRGADHVDDAGPHLRCRRPVPSSPPRNPPHHGCRGRPCGRPRGDLRRWTWWFTRPTSAAISSRSRPSRWARTTSTSASSDRSFRPTTSNPTCSVRRCTSCIMPSGGGSSRGGPSARRSSWRASRSWQTTPPPGRRTASTGLWPT